MNKIMTTEESLEALRIKKILLKEIGEMPKWEFAGGQGGVLERDEVIHQRAREHRDALHRLDEKLSAVNRQLGLAPGDGLSN